MITIWPAQTQNKNLVQDLRTFHIQGAFWSQTGVCLKQNRKSFHLIFKTKDILKCSFEITLTLIFPFRLLYCSIIGFQIDSKNRRLTKSEQSVKFLETGLIIQM